MKTPVKPGARRLCIPWVLGTHPAQSQHPINASRLKGWGSTSPGHQPGAFHPRSFLWTPILEEVTQGCYLVVGAKTCAFYQQGAQPSGTHHWETMCVLMRTELTTDRLVICHLGCRAGLAFWPQGLPGSLNFSLFNAVEAQRKFPNYELHPWRK